MWTRSLNAIPGQAPLIFGTLNEVFCFTVRFKIYFLKSDIFKYSFKLPFWLKKYDSLLTIQICSFYLLLILLNLNLLVINKWLDCTYSTVVWTITSPLSTALSIVGSNRILDITIVVLSIRFMYVSKVLNNTSDIPSSNVSCPSFKSNNINCQDLFTMSNNFIKYRSLIS